MRQKKFSCLNVLGVLFMLLTVINSQDLFSDSAYRSFLATLERYEKTKNDIVFLLDESGSIGADKFPEVKNFTKIIVQRLFVSADYSRVAVLTFATNTVTHADYIASPDGNNMCTLRKKIDDIPYIGEMTHTDVAMKKAAYILDESRHNSNRIIILLTDGHSNGNESPVPIAKLLKSRGIVIFAIGVADVNEQEIEDLATSKNHTYILSNFDYIVTLNKKLVTDLHDEVLDLEDPSYCQDKCDSNAKCYCGARTGVYECICNAGYFGTGGYKGQCHQCPKGTYKKDSGNVERCETCPDHSTTKHEGSTSSDDCICDTGYDKTGKICSPVRCAPLTAPEGGILIPNHCDNTYGSQCSFRCQEGYCPFSCTSYFSDLLLNRTCLEERRWSNKEFVCEKMACTALSSPENGYYNCSEKGFTHGTTCDFVCEKGHELTVPKTKLKQGEIYTRTCVLGTWTGDDVKCEKTFCKRLKTNDILQVKPQTCSKQPMPFRSICTYACANGYALELDGNLTAGILKCEHNGKWSVSYNKISCRDIKKPYIKCPKSITAIADPNKGLAQVSWDKPNATDNTQYVQYVRIIRPEGLKKPHIFPIGETKIVYEAADGSNLTNTCSFLVTVLDTEPPKVLDCPSDIEIYHDSNSAIQVTWRGPTFIDNSGNVTYTSNRRSGDSFSWGPLSVVYFNATDPSNNTASCSFTVNVKPHPCPYYSPPANGVVTCDNWNHGRLCSIFCHEGFAFAAGKNVPNVYVCNQKNKNVWEWRPFTRGKLILPWPDCSPIQIPSSFNASGQVSYSVNSCSDKVLQKMRHEFFNVVKALHPVLCPREKGCTPENVKVTCNPITGRQKRDSTVSRIHLRSYIFRKNKLVRVSRQATNQKLTISFNIVLSPNGTEENWNDKEKSEPAALYDMTHPANAILKELEDEISLKVKDVYNISFVPKPEVSYGVIAMCSAGQIAVNDSCVNCPTGTYKDDISETCIDCPQASYQDEERQFSCKPCPVGYTTYEVKSKSRSDCKGPCQPGTYSETAFEPCFACPLNTYQDHSTRRECLKCPSGLNTWRVGADSLSDCVAPCKPGSFSDTGYEPCTLCSVSTFQDKKMQKTCEICPNRTSTSKKGANSIEDCKEIDVCGELRPCHYNSTCVQNDKDYLCICPEGLIGRNCEINLDDCASGPCLNNGTCIDGIGNFTCFCPDGWEGHQCEINKDDCTPNPCLNSGHCIDKVNAYECQCIPGFTGELCERNMYECKSNPCLNDGECFDKQNGYRCCCKQGYFGLNCETKLDNVCDTVICHNGGTCLSDKEGFICSCLQGFDGEFCEINIDDCREIHCENGGICVDGIQNATCICPKKFDGLYCETVLEPEFLLSFPIPPTISNYAKLENKYRLSAMTVAFFMRTSFSDPSSRATPISYSYRDHGHLVDNALTLLDINNFVLYIHGHEFHTEYSANRDSIWHHYAVTWEKMDGKWSFYVDGNVIKSGNAGADKYMHPGTFILGQEQDDLGSRFTTLEAFAGDITEFNVWDYALRNIEIKRISSSCGYTGNIIPWYTVSQSVHGDVVVSDYVDKCRSLGTCPENSCDCFYANVANEYSCKYDVEECLNENTCSYGQACISDNIHSYCNCSKGFEGRRCEYDIDECLDNNGGCSYVCVNDIGAGSHCECPKDMILSEDGKTCKDTSYCLKDGHIYMNGEVWMHICENCSCNQGIIHCEEIACSEVSCLPEETMITSPGECCPRCVAWSFCLISPQDTILSFDMSTYQIEGECLYTVVEDCIGGRFKVQIESVKNSTNETNLIIYQDCHKIVLSSNGSVYVDDRIATLPFQNEGFVIEDDNSVLSISTNSDLSVQWNFTHEALIAVPITDVHKMCGLCSRVEDYYVYSTGKYPLSNRFASVRTLSSDMFKFILSKF